MENLEVRILDRSFRLQVPESEKPLLMQAVQLVDSRMREIREGSRSSSIDRIAVNAALQIAYEFLSRERDQQQAQTEAPPHRSLIRRMDDELGDDIRRIVDEADDALRQADDTLRKAGSPPQRAWDSLD